MKFQVKWKYYLVGVFLLNTVMVQCESVKKKQVSQLIQVQTSVKNQTNAIPQSSGDVTFTSEWSRDSLTFRRPNATQSGNFYYQAVLITVSRTGVYTIRSESSINTMGFLYSPSFDKRKPRQDLIDSDDNSAGNRQFRLRRTLTVNQRYYLVVTTFSPSITGSFTIVISGPKEVDVIPITGPFGFIKTINSELQFLSPMFQRPYRDTSDYFYSLIKVTVQTSGDYKFQSSSPFDSYGLLYYPKFNPKSSSSNLIASDDDSGSFRQFLITHSLEADKSYFLVVTSYSGSVTGSFTVNATGPGSFDLVEITDEIDLIVSTLSSTLTRNDSTFAGLDFSSSVFYYKLFQINPKNSAYYRFESQSAINAALYIYQNNFSPVEPSINLIRFALDFSGSSFSPFLQYLESGIPYYIVVSTNQQNATGRFTIRISGRTSVTVVNISTSQSAAMNQSSSLSPSSPRFLRLYGEGDSYYYYRAFRLTVPISGLYSVYTTSKIDTFGYIYKSSFVAASPWQNMLVYNDQSGGRNQFELALLLNNATTYILVVTTYRGYTFGIFRVTVKGPSRATLVLRN